MQCAGVIGAIRVLSDFLATTESGLQAKHELRAHTMMLTHRGGRRNIGHWQTCRGHRLPFRLAPPVSQKKGNNNTKRHHTQQINSGMDRMGVVE